MTEEGTLVHILETILEESNNNAIDMFVINQLQSALLEMRMNTTISLNTLENIMGLYRVTDGEDNILVLKCLKSIVISNPSLIGFCLDILCDGMTLESSQVNKTILLETFYSCVLNSTNEIINEKIINCLTPFIKCYEDMFTEDYQDTFVNILKHCIQNESLKQKLLETFNSFQLSNDHQLRKILFE